jgi:hypothetical protein
MAARDIMPFASPLGGHTLALGAPVTASQVYLEGEVLQWTTGRLLVATDETATEIAGCGVAADRALNRDGTAAVADQMRHYWPFVSGGEWITRRFSTDGAGTAAAITGALRGQEIGFTVDANGVWFADTGATANVGIITRILNAEKREVYGTTTGIWVVFKILDIATP